MRKRMVLATLAGALFPFLTPQGAFADNPRCGYTHYCSEKSGDYGSSSDDPERYWNCQYDPYRDEKRDENGYQAPCRYSEECTNYARCKD